MKIVECPRDAMQGIEQFIPTDVKVAYLNQLIKVGFDTLDAGSFVSANAIPQMRDTAEVFQQLDPSPNTRVLAIVANVRGAREACRFTVVQDIGFPLSLSETFQQRNTNKSILQSINALNEIQELCLSHGKRLVTYLSMAFGNPYGDPYQADSVIRMTEILAALDVKVVSLADTVGICSPQQAAELYAAVSTAFPDLELGLHLHSMTDLAQQKIEAALKAGCHRLDGTVRGYGGCPMAENQLVGNLATETILEVMDQMKLLSNLDRDALRTCMMMADSVFPGLWKGGI